MVNIQEQIAYRFEELATQAEQIPIVGGESPHASAQHFYAWATSALNAIQGVFGTESSHYKSFQNELDKIDNNYVWDRKFETFKGIFLGAKSDVDGDYIFNIQSTFSGEIFGDFVATAKEALSEGHHDVAAVLASAALEDALKRFATSEGLSVENKAMDEVINALKSKGLVSGAQKTLLSAMPKIRNHAMHADWDKLTPQDTGSVIGFVEQFLLAHF